MIITQTLRPSIIKDSWVSFIDLHNQQYDQIPYELKVVAKRY